MTIGIEAAQSLPALLFTLAVEAPAFRRIADVHAGVLVVRDAVAAPLPRTER